MLWKLEENVYIEWFTLVCDILLQSTASSRFHAEIILNIKENYDIHNPEDISIEVNLKDHSKTGTFINGQSKYIVEIIYNRNTNWWTNKFKIRW